MTVGQTEGDVRGAAGGVDAQFLAQLAHQRENLLTGSGHGTDGHDQRIDHDVMGGNAEISGAFHDLLGHGKPHLGVFRNAGVVVRDCDDRDIVFLDQRQNQFKTVLFAGDRIEQRTPLGGLQSGLKRAGYRTVDAERQINETLDHLDNLAHQGRLGLVRVGIGVVNHARVDIEDRRACRSLCDGIGFNGREIARFQLGCQFLAARRIDPFADHAERFIKPDDGGFGFAFDDGAGHVLSLLVGGHG